MWCPYCGKQEYATRAAAWGAVRAMGLRSIYRCVGAWHASARRPRRRRRYWRDRERGGGR